MLIKYIKCACPGITPIIHAITTTEIERVDADKKVTSVDVSFDSGVSYTKLLCPLPLFQV